jgi:DNA-binding winged helix-turn-helix (wHTH) protein
MTKRRKCFGPFVLDALAGEVTRDGTQVAVMPTEYRLLVFLTAHPNELLTKEELLESVWSDAHVTEASLARAIATLRQALGDDAKDPHYIETVPRRGYKFIAAVAEDAAALRSTFRLLCEGRSYALQIGENILGRGRESVVPLEATGVSRRHAAVIVTPTGASIVDLDSTNGTFVRGERIHGNVALHDGDPIRIGPIELTFTTREHIASRTTDVI